MCVCKLIRFCWSLHNHFKLLLFRFQYFFLYRSQNKMYSPFYILLCGYCKCRLGCFLPFFCFLKSSRIYNQQLVIDYHCHGRAFVFFFVFCCISSSLSVSVFVLLHTCCSSWIYTAAPHLLIIVHKHRAQSTSPTDYSTLIP